MSDLPVPVEPQFSLPDVLIRNGWRLRSFGRVHTVNQRMGLGNDAMKIVLEKDVRGDNQFMRAEITINRPDQILFTEAVLKVAELAEMEPAGFKFEVARGQRPIWDRKRLSGG